MSVNQQIKIERDRILSEIEKLNLQLDGLNQYLKIENIRLGQIRSESITTKNDITMEIIVHIFNREKRFLHHCELCEILGEKTKLNINDIKPKVSTILANAKKDEIHNIVNIKYKNSKRFTFWGLSHWLDSSGDILNDYMYNRNF